jgi:hypothetical protein
MLNINSLEELGTSTIQPVKYLGIFRDIPMDPDKSMGTNTQAQKHSHSKSLSRINLWHNWCNEKCRACWEYTDSPICHFNFGRSDLQIIC